MVTGFGVFAVSSALKSALYFSCSLFLNSHLAARARITLIRSRADLPALAVAPFTWASAAMKYSSENL